MTKLEIIYYPAESWRNYAEAAHLAVFSEARPSALNRIDFALVVGRDATPLGYVTCRELDAESLYWQFGGAFPPASKSPVVLPCYRLFVEWCTGKYKRVTTLVASSNVTYLKLAMKIGFRIIGCRTVSGEVYVELLLNL
jgi:RimJ/RimL family protein N-acetyltransferase